VEHSVTMDGAVLLATGSVTPASLILKRESFLAGWVVVENASTSVDADIAHNGWKLFFLAGEMKSSAFGFSEQKALPSALKRFGAMAKALKCNSFEITQVTRSLLLGVWHVTVTGHARNLQQGALLSGELSGK